jgi:hypothetical protein
MRSKEIQSVNPGEYRVTTQRPLPLPEKKMPTRTQATERMAEFTSKYRLRLNDTGAEKVVPGRYGEIADMGDDGLRLRLLALPRGANTDRTLRARRAKALAGGLTLKWNGQAESIFCFDPASDAHAQLAISLAGAKKKRLLIMNEDQRQALAARLAAARSQRLQRAA